MPKKFKKFFKKSLNNIFKCECASRTALSYEIKPLRPSRSTGLAEGPVVWSRPNAPCCFSYLGQTGRQLY